MPRYHRPRPKPHLAGMRAVPMFAGLPDGALRRIDRQVAELAVPAGTVLTRQHELGREAFIVIEGRASVTLDGRPVSSVAAGELIGEVALLDGGRRTATVTALTPMRLYVLDAAQFGTLFEEPETSRWIAAHLAKRVRAQATPLVTG